MDTCYIDDAFAVKFERIKAQLRENYKQQRMLIKEMNDLMAIHKESTRKIKKPKNTGFTKPEKIPDGIRSLLNITEREMSRTDVTKLLYKYFTDNNMYDTNSRREIVPNDSIRKIFHMAEDDTLTFYNLQSWLKNAYINK